MGATNSKNPEMTIKAIRSNTEDIRTSLRSKQVPLQSKEDLHQVLVNNSKQLDTMRASKSKKKQLEIDQIQKLVRDVNEELLVYNDQNLDKNADESHSFIHVGGDQLKNRKQKSPKTPRSRKNAREKQKTKRPPNINDIEQKLANVKDIVTTGLKTNDINLLQSQKKVIEELSTDLELLNIPQNSSSYTKKINLEKDLRRYYQKIIRREKNKDKLDTRQSEDTDNTEQGASKLRNIEILLEEIHNMLQTSVKDDNCGNLKEINDELSKIEKELTEIQSTDDSNEKSKTLLMKRVIQSEEFVREMEKKKEMNDLDEMMDEIDKLKTEVQIQKEMNKGKVIQEIEAKHRKLKNLEVKHSENKKFRDDYLEELDTFLEKIQPNNYSVVMRQKKLKASKSVEDLIHLQEEWTSLQNKMSVTKLDEVEKVNDLLQKFEESIRAKRQSLTKMMKNVEPNRRRSEEIIRTSAKIYDLPKIETAKSKENKVNKTEHPHSSSHKKYGSIEYALEEITKISDRVEEIGKEVICFDGVTENLEYNFFTAALMDKRTILNKLKHRASWNQVDAFKNEVLEKIDFYEEYLRYKLNQNKAEEKISGELNEIENKISRFTGSFQNINFKQLEVELSNCQKEITQIDNKEKNELFKTRINYLRKILKEKSQTEMDLIYEENLTDTKKIITENEEYIKTLKENVENLQVLDVNQCALIEDCLMSKTLELINLNVKNDSPSFDKMKKLLEEIETCKSLVKTKRRTMEEVQREIEEELDKLQMEISFFEGLPNDEQYSGLMRTLEDLEVKLCTVRGTEESSEKNLEISLRINYLKNRLDKLSLVSERMSQIERRVREILEIVSEGIQEKDFDILDEELINTKIEVEKLEVSEKLSYRKITCLSYIEYLLKKMNEKMDRSRAQVSSSVLV
ncbi:uncharacterized protein PFB0765w-like [Coccinella septempunctata]|uniref:uncharacterized protein PFB0765w-like n=1 Tax=Coccinella septempunctata TaxID=41139 RepID=UPI001D0775D3|nr:uncharacterized protein PFB0765w-like [Coccinella septempunctata]